MKKIYFLEISLLFLFILFEVAIFKTTDHLGEQKVDDIVTQRLSIFSTQYQAIDVVYKNHADLIYEEVINSKKIISILEQLRDADKQKKDALRIELKETLEPVYTRLQKKNLRQLHFHLPNSDSFLRMHAPLKFGDSLVGVRKSVEIANSELRRVHGFEEGRVFNGFRNVYPLFDTQGRHIGSVEISLSFSSLKNEIEKMTDSYVDFIISEKLVEDKVWDEFKDFYIACTFCDGYLKEKNDKSNYPKGMTEEIASGITKKLKDEISLGIESKESFALFTEYRSSGYIIAFYPIQNIEGQNAAAYLYTVVRTDVPMYIKNDYGNMALIISVLNALIFFFIYLIVSKNRKLESQRFLLEKQNVDLENTNMELAQKEKELSFLNDTLSEQIEHEVAERMKILKQHETQKNLMYQQSRMAETGSMISAIAHQWKQPLNALSMISQLLREMVEDRKEEPIDDIEAEKYFNQIDTQIQFMSQTVNDFRNFFKPSKKAESFVPSEKIEKILSMYKNEFIKNQIEVEIHSGEELNIVGYPNEFMQAILIIFNNAKDAISQNQIKGGKIECFFEKSGRFGVIRIRDNGGGIPEYLLPKLFDAYVSTKGENGTGIGLQIAKSIVDDNMKGELLAHNVGKGAEFVIKIPLAKSEELT